MYRTETIEDRRVAIRSLDSSPRHIAVDDLTDPECRIQIGNVRHLDCGRFLSDAPRARKQSMLRHAVAEIVRDYNATVTDYDPECNGGDDAEPGRD